MGAGGRGEMGTSILAHSVRDRLDDPAGLEARPGRRAILTRRGQRRLWLLCLGLILYGTVGPVGSPVGRWIEPGSSWSWRLPWSASDYNDVLTNVVVFLPVGVFLRLLLRRRAAAGWVDLPLAVLLATGLSYAAEWTQQFMPARSANGLDVVVNGFGAAVGAALAPALQRLARSAHGWAYNLMHERPWDVGAAVLSAMTVILATVPWDLGWSAPRFDLIRPLNGEDVQRVGIFLLVGYACARVRQGAGRSPRAVWLGATASASLLVLLTESAQLFVRSHTPDLLDALLGMTAGGLGAAGAVARNRLRGGREESRIRVAVFVLIGSFLCCVGDDLARVASRGPLAPAAAETVIPFALHFRETFGVALTDLVNTGLLATIITAVALAAGGRAVAPIALTALLAICWLHLSFKWLFGQPGDLTPAIVVFAGWYGALSVHGLLEPQFPRASLPASG